MTDGNRPVRTRMPGGVGGAGSIPVPTRLNAVSEPLTGRWRMLFGTDKGKAFNL
jgi:hypothetical protein